MKLQPLMLALTLLSLAGCSLVNSPTPAEQRTSEIEVRQTAAVSNLVSRYDFADSTLRLVSLNMAHGRNDSFSQFFVSEAETRRNLAEIVAFLKREDADIVTLQEADAPSRWSGNFDHVELIARESGYNWYTHAHHVDNLFGTYGTAVLSRFPIARGFQVDFNPTPPTTGKGFALAEIEWTPSGARGETLIIDVVSVHLDFLRSSKRIEQIQDMKKILGQRANPTIVLGDFNSTWSEGEQELQSLARVRKLKTHRPDANHLFTYAEERFDWILVSQDFDFCDYYAASDTLSDHRAVVSEIVLIEDEPQLANCTIL